MWCRVLLVGGTRYGLQGTTCYCDNHYTGEQYGILPDGHCSTHCSSTSSSPICGGSTAISVYDVPDQALLSIGEFTECLPDLTPCTPFGHMTEGTQPSCVFCCSQPDNPLNYCGAKHLTTLKSPYMGCFADSKGQNAFPYLSKGINHTLDSCNEE